MAETCPHMDFEVHADIIRLEDIGAFSADIQIRCAQCKVRFAFKGLGMGLSREEPRTSPDRFELHAPIEPDAHTTMMMAGDEILGFPSDCPNRRQL